MAVRNRISVTLADKDLAELEQIAGDRGDSVATVATWFIAVGLMRDRVNAKLVRTVSVQPDLARERSGVAADIHAALTMPGVVDALSGNWAAAPEEARQAANYLARISSWLESGAGSGYRGPAPRLAQTFGYRQDGGPITRALDALTQLQLPTSSAHDEPGCSGASDNGGLSDMVPSSTDGASADAI